MSIDIVKHTTIKTTIDLKGDGLFKGIEYEAWIYSDDDAEIETEDGGMVRLTRSEYVISTNNLGR